MQETGFHCDTKHALGSWLLSALALQRQGHFTVLSYPCALYKDSTQRAA